MDKLYTQSYQNRARNI